MLFQDVVCCSSSVLAASSLSKRLVSMPNCSLIKFMIWVSIGSVGGAGGGAAAVFAGLGGRGGVSLIGVGVLVGCALVTTGEETVDTLPRRFLRAVGSVMMGLLALP